MGNSKYHKRLNERINSFLSSIDTVLNSNTFLLTIAVGSEIKDLCEYLSNFIKCEEFKRLMLEQDVVRQWSMFGLYNYIEERWEELYCNGEFYKENFQLSINELTFEEYKIKLISMLTTDKSFYKKQLSQDDATQATNNFLKDLLGEQINGWRFFNVNPDFLNITYLVNSQTDEEERNPSFSYFDGYGFDSCTVFYNNANVHILLTNGMP